MDGVTSEQAVFESTVESLYRRGLADRVTPALKNRLRAAGIDLDRPLKAAYPRTAWESCLHATAEELYAEVPREQALFELGRLLVAGAMQTVVGKAVLGLVKVLGPRRTLSRMTRNFRSANNYMETKIEELGANSFMLWINETSNAPTYVAGTVDYGLRAAGAEGLVVEVVRREGRGAVLSVRWSG